MQVFLHCQKWAFEYNAYVFLRTIIHIQNKDKPPVKLLYGATLDLSLLLCCHAKLIEKLGEQVPQTISLDV